MEELEEKRRAWRAGIQNKFSGRLFGVIWAKYRDGFRAFLATNQQIVEDQ